MIYTLLTEILKMLNTMNTKILIVEDEKIITADITGILNRAGYCNTAIACTEDEALSLSESFKPDIALIDIMTNGSYDGIKLSSELIENKGIPVIFITEDSEPIVVERSIPVSPYGYLIKPFREMDLLITLEMGLQRHRLEIELRQIKEIKNIGDQRFRTIFEASPIGSALYDSSWNLLHINSAFMKVFGVSEPAELTKFNLFKNLSINLHDISRLHTGDILRFEFPFDFSIQTDNEGIPGETLYLETIISPLNKKMNGSYDFFLFQVQDITERKINEETLLASSILDPLTGAFNRRGFIDMARRHIDLARRTGREMAIAFLDLDKLKVINDNYGHEQGDLAIKISHEILKESFRTSDVIARWGGDEFIVLLINSECDDAAVISERLRQQIDKYRSENGLLFNISMSIGITKFDPLITTDINQLIETADRSMYNQKQKRTGENIYG
jgi:diguanylate cyclase (GGDEF)-like protein/PAS domain S-box-containing protein